LAPEQADWRKHNQKVLFAKPLPGSASKNQRVEQSESHPNELYLAMVDAKTTKGTTCKGAQAGKQMS